MTIVTHKIRIKTNKYLDNVFTSWSNCSRYSYNFVLSKWEQWYKWNQEYLEDCQDLLITPDKECLYKVKATEIRKELIRIKNTREDRAFLKEAPSSVLSNASLQVGDAFDRFFKGLSSYPKFKIKDNINPRFKLDNAVVKYEDKRLKIPKIGWISLCESLRFKGRILSCVISKRAEYWYVSLVIELDKEIDTLPKTDQNIGIDLGVKTFITDSNGNEIHSPRPLKRYLKKLKRAQRKLSRKKKGSNNYIRAKTKLAKLHNKVANIRNTFLHTTTKNIVKLYDNIVIEDLSIQQMMNKFGKDFNRSLNDLSFYEFRRQLEYKSELYRKNLIIADKYYPSSKLCSYCGYKKENLVLTDREWTCPSCDSSHNRDVNAAKNLLKLV